MRLKGILVKPPDEESPSTSCSSTGVQDYHPDEPVSLSTLTNMSVMHRGHDPTVIPKDDSPSPHLHRRQTQQIGYDSTATTIESKSLHIECPLQVTVAAFIHSKCNQTRPFLLQPLTNQPAP